MKVLLTRTSDYNNRGKVVEIGTLEGLMALASSEFSGVLVYDRHLQKERFGCFVPHTVHEEIQYMVALNDA